MVGDAPENFTNRRLIAKLAEEHHLPAIYPFPEGAEVGGLMDGCSPQQQMDKNCPRIRKPDPRRSSGRRLPRSDGEISPRVRLISATISSDIPVGERGLGDMVGYAMRRVPRERPSKDQRTFLERLRDLGPQDNAQTAAIRKITKRACQVRGWVEWRWIDQCPGVRAWHLTLIGRNALNSLIRRQSLVPAPRLPTWPDTSAGQPHRQDAPVHTRRPSRGAGQRRGQASLAEARRLRNPGGWR